MSRPNLATRAAIMLVVYGGALWTADWLVDGVRFAPGFGNLVVVTALFVLVHTVVAPLVRMVTCLFYVLTLGLFHFVVNALLLMFTAWAAGPRFDVDGFWDAFLGALVVSLASSLLGAVFGMDDGEHAGDR